MSPPEPVPQVYFGGSSQAAGPVAARYVDVYLTWGEPPAQVAEKIAWMRRLAAEAEPEISPGLWAGIGLVRGGAGTALVGSHEQVADRIEEYAALGIDEFIFSGYPHLEEAYWFGEGVLPELRRRGSLAAAGLPVPEPALAPA